MIEVNGIRMNSVICDDGIVGEMYYTICQQGNEKSKLLRKILFEEDVSDRKRMKDLIYEFGSLLGVKDVLERKIFVILATMF